MTHTTITDLQVFINPQRYLGIEIIINIDANETANCKKSNIIKIYRNYQVYDPISMNHETTI